MPASKTLAQREERAVEKLSTVSTRVRESLLKRAKHLQVEVPGLTLQQLFDQGLELRLSQIEPPTQQERK